MRTILLLIVFAIASTCVIQGAPLSEGELKNLLAFLSRQTVEE